MRGHAPLQQNKKAVYFPSPAKEVKQTAFILGVFYKLVLMEILYLGLTWPLLHFSLASCCISKTHIARYARL